MLCPAGQTKRNNLTEKALICLVKALFTRAYIRNYFPKKVFTHSHNARFLLISNGFKCEGFEFKVFTWAGKHSQSIHTAR